MTAAHCVAKIPGGAASLCVVAGYTKAAVDGEKYDGIMGTDDSGTVRDTCEQLSSCKEGSCPQVLSAKIAISGVGPTGTVDDWVILELGGTLSDVSPVSGFQDHEAGTAAHMLSHPMDVPLMRGALEPCGIEDQLVHSVASALDGSSGGAVVDANNVCLGMHIDTASSTYRGCVRCSGRVEENACTSTCTGGDASCGMKLSIPGPVLGLAVKKYAERDPKSARPRYFQLDGDELVEREAYR